MTTILLVHGTGVRQASFDKTFAQFAAHMAKIRPDWQVAPCSWGEPHGSRLHRAGMSIPPRNEVDREIALWHALELDPLYELGLLASQPLVSVSLPPDAPDPGEGLAELALTLPAVLAGLLDAVDLGDAFAPAIGLVLDSDECREALRREAELGDALRSALARAFVARAVALEEEGLEGHLPLDGDSRDGLVDAVVAVLGGSDRGIAGAIGKFAMRTLLRMGATRPLERRRRGILEASAPELGDVLMYLTRGARIRDFIASRVAEEDGPVVLVGHSLGGIASVELLAMKSLPAVELLVTVGSQAPLLYELNALPALEFGAPLPATVPRWINVYDIRDMLGYIGAPIFPGRVEDFAVDNKVPFPRAHSAYFGNLGFYTLLDEVLPL